MVTIVNGVSNIDMKVLFEEFLFAELESEVTSIIQKYDLNDPQFWLPYGKQASNYSIIGNQSSTAEGALAEKLTNAVDALMVKMCMKFGIDPESPNAPKNFKEALAMFWGIKDGDFTEISKEVERDILNDLVLMVTTKDAKVWKDLKSEQKQLSVSLYDNGEGQSPNRLPETILSLLKGNKHKIPFTQGNHNQGGSSTLMHGGEFSYTLIISKRNTEIVGQFDAPDDDSLDYWGWTLIRQELRPNETSPVFTYFAPNGKVPRFIANQLNLLPKVLKGSEAKLYLEYDNSCTAGIPYTKPVESGTYIKMFNYQLKNKGPLVSHFKYEMGKRLFDTGLPFNLIDCRKNKFNNETIFRGMSKILKDDLHAKGDNKLVVDGFPDTSYFDIVVENQFTIKGGKREQVIQRVNVTVFGFNKRDSNKKDENSIIGEKPIIFTLGQQVQGGLDGRILSSIGLSSIKNSLLIVLEFPNIHPAFKKDLFMTDRERILDKAPKKEIIKNLKTYLENSEKIRKFKEDRIEQSLKNTLSTDSDELKELMDKWASNNPSIIKGLMDGKLLFGKARSNSEDTGGIGIGGKGNSAGGTNGGRRGGGGTVNVPDLKEEPTFFIPRVKDVEGIFTKTVKQQANFKLSFTTDAPINYFEREINPGLLTVTVDEEHLPAHFVRDMKPGVFSLSFTNDFTKRLGKRNITVQINCVQTGFNSSFTFSIEIVKEEVKKQKSSNKLGLPEFIEIGLDAGWDGVNDETAALLDGERIVINKENKHLLAHIRNLSEETDVNYAKGLYRYSMLFSAISSKSSYLEAHSSANETESNDKFLSLEDSVIQDTKAVARTLFVNENLALSIRKGM